MTFENLTTGQKELKLKRVCGRLLHWRAAGKLYKALVEIKFRHLADSLPTSSIRPGGASHWHRVSQGGRNRMRGKKGKLEKIQRLLVDLTKKTLR